MLPRMCHPKCSFILLLPVLVILQFSVKAQAPRPESSEEALQTLLQYMSGSFSSERQSRQDTAFFDIRLHMRPIWTARTDGYWLYVEQAMAAKMDAPYRQRIYRLYQENDSVLVSKAFEMKQPLRFAGAWQDPARLGQLLPDSLIDRTGCEIRLKRSSGSVFSGSTPGKECLSNLRGARYATSEVRVTANGILSWDRGWDAEDKQVWGAVKGGYAFDKLRSLP